MVWCIGTLSILSISKCCLNAHCVIRAESLLKKCFHSKCMMFVQHSMMINAFNYVTLWHKLQYPHSLLLESGAELQRLILSATPCIWQAWISFYDDIAMLISFLNWKGLPFPVICICGNMLSHYIMALLKKINFSWEQNSYSRYVSEYIYRFLSVWNIYFWNVHL
jgi:hypothetical protein